MSRLMLISLIFVFLAGCVPVAISVTPTENPDAVVVSPPGNEEPVPAGPGYGPQPGDEKLERGNVFPNSMELLTLESYPPQFVLALSGSLPTPCHNLRVAVAEPVDGKINVDVYSLVDPNMMCAQVLEEFQVNVPLGSPPAGKYEVLVNGVKAGEIEWK